MASIYASVAFTLAVPDAFCIFAYSALTFLSLPRSARISFKTSAGVFVEVVIGKNAKGCPALVTSKAEGAAITPIVVARR